MAVDTINFSLPEVLKQFVDVRVSTGGYGSASEYLRELIRRDQEEQRRSRERKEHLEALLLEGINSGEPIAWNAEHHEQHLQRLKLLAENRRRAE